MSAMILHSGSDRRLNFFCVNKTIVMNSYTNNNWLKISMVFYCGLKNQGNGVPAISVSGVHKATFPKLSMYHLQKHSCEVELCYPEWRRVLNTSAACCTLKTHLYLDIFLAICHQKRQFMEGKDSNKPGKYFLK